VFGGQEVLDFIDVSFFAIPAEDILQPVAGINLIKLTGDQQGIEQSCAFDGFMRSTE
jgi:hypothetical protein